MQQTLFPFGLEPCSTRLVLSIGIYRSFEGCEGEDIDILWLNILLFQDRYITVVLLVSRAVCCNAL